MNLTRNRALSGNGSGSDTGRAASITRASSRHTYLTIRWLVDRDLREDAYWAYAYFRWLDDLLDESLPSCEQRLAFVAAQKALMARAFAGDVPDDLSPEEQFLVRAIRNERRSHPGLRSYLHNMLWVMEFDARRRGRLITQAELDRYTHTLSVAVMDGLSYFVGHRYRYPDGPARYRAVQAAHITHMLRDAVADADAGYFNIPSERLDRSRISPAEVHAPAYRQWVRERTDHARRWFREGKRYISGLAPLRVRIAGFAYCARFEAVLDAVELDGFLLRRDYPAEAARAGGLGSALRAGWQAILRTDPARGGESA